MTSRHPYSYMDTTTINHLLLCSVCNHPFVDPVTAEDQRRGCRTCLSSSSSVKPIQEFIVLEMLNSLRVRCTQCEETNIRRGDLKQHEQKACRRAVVPCKAADIKCPWKGPREQLDAHMDHCVFEPLRPALSEMIMEIKQLKEQLTRLENGVKERQV